MTKITTVTDNSKQALEEYVKKDLKRRFDAEKNPALQLPIIDETRFTFGFTEEAKKMIDDFEHDYPEMWAQWEHSHGRDVVSDEADRHYEWEEEQQRLWAYDEERKYRLPETNYDRY